MHWLLLARDGLEVCRRRVARGAALLGYVSNLKLERVAGGRRLPAKFCPNLGRLCPPATRHTRSRLNASRTSFPESRRAAHIDAKNRPRSARNTRWPWTIFVFPHRVTLAAIQTSSPMTAFQRHVVSQESEPLSMPGHGAHIHCCCGAAA